MGLKTIDVSAIDPLTNQLMQPQTRNGDQPARIITWKERTQMHADCTNPIYQWWGETDSQNTETNIMLNECKPFQISCPSDMRLLINYQRKEVRAKTSIFLSLL